MIRIRNFQPADTDDILAIADVQLGEKYITVDDLSACNVIVVEDVELQKCVGFCLSYVGQDGKSYVRTVAVNPDHSGLGIGTVLVAKAVDYLQSIGAKKIMSPLWKHDDIVNSDVIFRRNGFFPVLEIPDYWYADSIAKGYSCPVCGKGCHCTCVMYELAMYN
ncbi:MAG: GNAT family N-acetyltransferase [Bacteroidales bacterium]|nr:GNAT family N-acetyltransferase [Bacteroidales bacterium]